MCVCVCVCVCVHACLRARAPSVFARPHATVTSIAQGTHGVLTGYSRGTHGVRFGTSSATSPTARIALEIARAIQTSLLPAQRVCVRETGRKVACLCVSVCVCACVRAVRVRAEHAAAQQRQHDGATSARRRVRNCGPQGSLVPAVVRVRA